MIAQMFLLGMKVVFSRIADEVVGKGLDRSTIVLKC